VYVRVTWKILGALLVVSALFVAGTERVERAARLTLTWMDNAGGIAKFIVERKTGASGTYAPIATTGTAITTYIDTAVVAGITYCYRVKAFNASGESSYSNEACASAAPR
jgi:hypothetical protein